MEQQAREFLRLGVCVCVSCASGVNGGEDRPRRDALTDHGLDAPFMNFFVAPLNFLAHLMTHGERAGERRARTRLPTASCQGPLRAPPPHRCLSFPKIRPDVRAQLY